MSDLIMIIFAVLDILILWAGIATLSEVFGKIETAAIFMLIWVLSQPIYWAILLLIFNRRGL